MTKKWLAAAFGCMNAGGVDYRRLYRYVLTPEILSDAGIKPGEIRHKGCKTFTAIQSDALARVLNL